MKIKTAKVPTIRLPYVAAMARFAHQSKNVSEIKKLARQIVEKTKFGSGIDNDLILLYNIAVQNDLVQVHRHGVKADASRSTDFLQLILQYYAESTIVTREDLKKVQAFCKKLAHEEEDLWYSHLFDWLLSFVAAKFRFIGWAKRLYQIPWVASLLSASEGLNLDSQCTELIGRLHELRRYGIKESWTQNGLELPDMAWVIIDPYTYQEAIGSDRLVFSNDNLAIFQQAKVADITSFTVVTEEKWLDPNWGEKSFIGSIPAITMLCLNKQGELFLTMAETMALKNLLDQAGLYGINDLLKLFLTIEAFDLMVPVEKVKEMPPTPRPVRGQDNEAMPFESVRQEIKELLVPRIRYISHPKVPEEILEEISRDNEATDSKRKSPQRHLRKGNERKLPKGWQVSPSAIARAQKEGWGEITPGYTYVRTHERGVGELRNTLPHLKKRTNK